jgi:hypothetical protein
LERLSSILGLEAPGDSDDEDEEEFDESELSTAELMFGKSDASTYTYEE